MLVASYFLVSATAAGTHLGSPSLVTPPWNYTIQRHGEVCTDASESHAPHSEHNTRWTFWALPQTPPPQGGYPIYMELQAEIMYPGDWRTPVDQLPVCGNGWIPPADGWYRPQYNVFDTPTDAMATCFRDDGSWRPLSFSGHDCETTSDGHKACCTFFQVPCLRTALTKPLDRFGLPIRKNNIESSARTNSNLYVVLWGCGAAESRAAVAFSIASVSSSQWDRHLDSQPVRW